MPVPTKLDPVALPEKGRYVEGTLLYAVDENALNTILPSFSRLDQGRLNLHLETQRYNGHK